MAIPKKKELTALRIRMLEEQHKNSLSTGKRFTARLTSKDKYNYKIVIPKDHQLPREYRKSEIYPLQTSSSAVTERLFNIVFTKSEMNSIEYDPSPQREALVPKKIAVKIGLKEGDEIEIMQITKGEEILLFCSDISKNEEIEKVRDNVLRAIEEKSTTS